MAEYLLGREWLRFECLGSGIVEELGDKKLKFWHMTFQEYLATQALAWLGDGEVAGEDWWPAVKGHLADAQWRESVALLPGTLFEEGGKQRVDHLLLRVLALQNRWRLEQWWWLMLGMNPFLAKDAHIAGIMGHLLEPMTSYQYIPPLEIRQSYQQVLKRAMAIFTKEGAAQVPIKIRIEAAEALGQAGDPRLNQNNFLPVPGTNWLLGKYLVTVAEFHAFVDEDGYQEQRWWDDTSWQKWESPDNWEYQLLHLTWPVTGVSWFEAVAYCRWLSEKKKRDIHLPDEGVWDKAVKGKYPWGEDEPTPELANFDRNVGSPTPVGLYPAGDGPFGHCDLAGNVWEWQRNLAKNANATDTLLDEFIVGDNEMLTWQGGSWANPADNLRLAYRHWNHAVYRNDNVGFRLAAPAST